MKWLYREAAQIPHPVSHKTSLFGEDFPHTLQTQPSPLPQLDELGSQVWQMLDGTRTTADLIREFATAHKVSAQEAEQSITLFLRELGKRGLIALH